MNDTLPKDVTDALSDFAREVENTMGWDAGPATWKNRDEARASLVSAILDYARDERERGLAEVSGLLRGRLYRYSDAVVTVEPISDEEWERLRRALSSAPPRCPHGEPGCMCQAPMDPAPPSPGERERGATVKRVALLRRMAGFWRRMASGEQESMWGGEEARRALEMCGGSLLQALTISEGEVALRLVGWGAPSRSERTEDARCPYHGTERDQRCICCEFASRSPAPAPQTTPAPEGTTEGER